MDSIKTTVYLPNENFTDVVLSEITIKCLGYDERVKDVMYRYDLPKYLYDKLVDSQNKFRSYQNYLKNKEEVKRRGVHSFNNEDEFYLAKHFTEKLISLIVSQVNDLSHEAVAIGKRNTLVRKKKIFVRFNSEVFHDRFEWTHGYMGEKVIMGFQFFVGYEIEEKKNLDTEISKNYYTLIRHSTGTTSKKSTNFKEGEGLEPLHYHNSQSRNGFIRMFHILDWTQEREDFFNNHILNKFKELDQRLKEYFSNLDEDKINLLMSNNSQKLLTD